MVSLDINTPLGQESLRHEQEAAALWENLNPGWKYVTTNKAAPCVVDGILMRGGEIAAVVETKARSVDEKGFAEQFNSEWLMTLAKLEKAKAIAHGMGVPLVGFLYLIPSQVLLVRRLAENGEFVVPMRIDNTTTQATINGGTAVRCNAFINMAGATTRRLEKFHAGHLQGPKQSGNARHRTT